MSQKPGYDYTTERVCNGFFSFQMAPGDIDNWKGKGLRRVEIEFETCDVAQGFMQWLKDHGVQEAKQKPPYNSPTPTFTLKPADVLAAVKFRNSVYHISFGNAHIAESFEVFCHEAGVNLDDSRGDVESTVEAVKFELDELKKTHARLSDIAKTIQKERDSERVERERLEDRVERLLERERALQEALTDAAERELYLKRRLDT